MALRDRIERARGGPVERTEAMVRDGTEADVTASGGVARAEVRIRVPVLFSGLELPRPVTREATFPVTGRCP